ncbi:hypothetical protein BHM03_00027776, partial [Ensete ventricosum]
AGFDLASRTGDMVGGGSRRDDGPLNISSTNVFAALETLKKKKKSSKESKGKGSSKRHAKDPEPQVFWAPTPLTVKSWADVDDDDDYFATTAPPQSVWGSSEQQQRKEAAAVVEEVCVPYIFFLCYYTFEFDGRQQLLLEHMLLSVMEKPVPVSVSSKDAERHMSKKEIKKKEMAELDAILNELGISSKDCATKESKGSEKKKKAKKEKSSKDTKQQLPHLNDTKSRGEEDAAAAAADVKERLRKVASTKKKKSNREMDAAAKVAAVEAAARTARLAAAKKKEKSHHYNQQPVRSRSDDPPSRAVRPRFLPASHLLPPSIITISSAPPSSIPALTPVTHSSVSLALVEFHYRRRASHEAPSSGSTNPVLLSKLLHRSTLDVLPHHQQIRLAALLQPPQDLLHLLLLDHRRPRVQPLHVPLPGRLEEINSGARNTIHLLKRTLLLALPRSV